MYEFDVALTQSPKGSKNYGKYILFKILYFTVFAGNAALNTKYILIPELSKLDQGKKKRKFDAAEMKLDKGGKETINNPQLHGLISNRANSLATCPPPTPTCPKIYCFHGYFHESFKI